jgi:hypothetical protein
MADPPQNPPANPPPTVEEGRVSASEMEASTDRYFGFAEAGSAAGFGSAPFFSGGGALVGSMGLNAATLNETPAHGRSVSAAATATVIHSPELLRAFEAVKTSLREVETLAAVVLSSYDRLGIGGNFPPEPIDELLLGGDELRDLRELISALKKQTVIPGSEAILAAAKSETLGGKLLEQAQKRADEFASGFFNRLGENTANIVFPILILIGVSTLFALSKALIALGHAAQTWLKLAGMIY